MEYYERLRVEANKSVLRRQYVAVLTHRGKIISIGHNHPRRHSSQSKSCVL